MKLIEAMKQVKSLLVKADDLRKKIGQHSAILSIETPVYESQDKQVSDWLQAHGDIMQEIGSLQVRIAKTNLATQVTIKLGEKNVLKCITEWIARYTFAVISRAIGLRPPTHGGRHGHGPRIQDLRHRFAAETLIGWYRAGVDVERALPTLSTYLGHVHTADTYWYLEAIPELLQLAADRSARPLVEVTP